MWAVLSSGVHIPPVLMDWSVAPQPGFEASVVRTMSAEGWTTEQPLNPCRYSTHQWRSTSASCRCESTGRNLIASLIVLCGVASEELGIGEVPL